MPKISFLKLLFVLVAVLTVAGVGYGSLVVWRERASIDTKELVSGEKPAREGQPTIEPLSPLSPTEPSVTDIDIFDWKTYVNEYGYELQYPSNWFPSSSSEGSYFVVSAARPEEFVYGTLPEGDAAVTVTVAYRSKQYHSMNGLAKPLTLILSRLVSKSQVPLLRLMVFKAKI
jgi:hypothetical protein